MKDKGRTERLRPWPGYFLFTKRGHSSAIFSASVTTDSIMPFDGTNWPPRPERIPPYPRPDMADWLNLRKAAEQK